MAQRNLIAMALALLLATGLALAQQTPPATPDSDSVFGWLIVSVVQLFFLMVPLSVILQIYAWRKLEGRPNQLARISGWLMAALWLFVVLTALAGSNLSPIWVVFLSPIFVVYLLVLIRQSRRNKSSAAVP